MPRAKADPAKWDDTSEYSKADYWLLYTYHNRMMSHFLKKFADAGDAPKAKRGPAKGTKYGPRKKAAKTSKPAE